MGTSFRSWSYWYFHLPNFVLAALMYTLLGRVLLGLFVDPDFEELHLALLLPHHRSGRRAGCAGHAEGGGARRAVAVRLRLAVLAARGAATTCCWSLGAARVGVSRSMDRNFYYIGIAFFGMINGMFNQLWLIFALIYVQAPGGPAAVRQRRRSR